MIAKQVSALGIVVQLLAPLIWRSERRMARKLEGFAATEAGSALDMLKAAELCDDPRLRRLFFRHAMDEARHAQLFRQAAQQIDPDPLRRGTDYHLIHASRQNLYERLGPTRFMAFVHLAEKSGEAQFRALERHFARQERPELEQLFARIGKDERFHVGYSGAILRRWKQEGRGREVRRALLRTRLDRAWQAWRRAGRVLGDLMSRAILSVVYLVAFPIFVLIQRIVEPERPGWKVPARNRSASLAEARRQG
jgi:rubrerythrin